MFFTQISIWLAVSTKCTSEFSFMSPSGKVTVKNPRNVFNYNAVKCFPVYGDVRTSLCERSERVELRYAAAAGAHGICIDYGTFEALSCNARYPSKCGVYGGAVKRDADETGGALETLDCLFWFKIVFVVIGVCFCGLYEHNDRVASVGEVCVSVTDGILVDFCVISWQTWRFFLGALILFWGVCSADHRSLLL